jgi:hypothetical protein
MGANGTDIELFRKHDQGAFKVLRIILQRYHEYISHKHGIFQVILKFKLFLSYLLDSLGPALIMSQVRSLKHINKTKSVSVV